MNFLCQNIKRFILKKMMFTLIILKKKNTVFQRFGKNMKTRLKDGEQILKLKKRK